MTTPWENDVGEALACALAGRSENWPTTARVLAAEVAALRGQLRELVRADKMRCPECGRQADSVEHRLGEPTRYRHGQFEHRDLTAQLRI